MLVRDALVPDPLVVGPSTSVVVFCRLVLESNQTTAIVLDDDRNLLGLVSVHDVFQRIVPHYVGLVRKLASIMREGYFEEKFAALAQVSVDELMVESRNELAPTDSLIKAVALFAAERHKTVPVVEDGKWIGTITRRSVLRTVIPEEV